MMDIRMKRIYDPASREDGYRMLVDRLWPRGVSKASASLDEWSRDVSPSHALRKWFGHAPEKRMVFEERYREELRENQAAVERIRDLARKKRLTLLFATKDINLSHVPILRNVILNQRH